MNYGPDLKSPIRYLKELLWKKYSCLCRREEVLFQCALAVEKDEALNNDMVEWDVTAGDGIEPEV